jgi:hypothetical protein
MYNILKEFLVSVAYADSVNLMVDNIETIKRKTETLIGAIKEVVLK